jgi:hypothetical protein
MAMARDSHGGLNALLPVVSSAMAFQVAIACVSGAALFGESFRKAARAA